MSATLLECGRIRNGDPVILEMAVVYQDDNPAELPQLFVFSGRSKRQGGWLRCDHYRVEEIPAADGRGFLLHRSPEAVAKDGEERYGVLINANGQDHLCECRGHAVYAKCKHVEALLGLIQAGHLDDPRRDPRPEVIVDQLIEAPF